MGWLGPRAGLRPRGFARGGEGFLRGDESPQIPAGLETLMILGGPSLGLVLAPQVGKARTLHRGSSRLGALELRPGDHARVHEGTPGQDGLPHGVPIDEQGLTVGGRGPLTSPRAAIRAAARVVHDEQQHAQGGDHEHGDQGNDKGGEQGFHGRDALHRRGGKPLSDRR